MRPDIHTRFFVIGSGAGGSVVAYHLARLGEAPVVLERGKWVQPADISHDELSMLTTLYRDGGAQTNTDVDMFVLQGQCVGGSTVLTNAVCLRMPETVRQRFADRGFELPPDALDASYRRVESVLNVHPLEESVYNPAAFRLADGMRSLGIEPGRFDKAMLHCIGCGYCNMGCRYGRKLDASVTWVPMARDRGAEIVTEAEAVRIEWSRSGAVRAVVCRDLRDGSTFRVRAERYVLAGGAIATPELLLRSGIKTGRAGKRTSFNAGAIMFAEFDDPIDGFAGDQMCVHHFGDGYLIEQIHNPPLSFALTMPGWFDRHQSDMQRYRNLTSAGVLVPTEPNGRVFLGLGNKLLPRVFDAPNLEFRLGERDLGRMRRGLEQLARIWLASGAKRVVPPLSAYTEIRSEDDVPLISERLRDQRDLVGFGSSHPQGGSPVGDDPRRDVVDPEFRVHGFENLFVADASLFPESIEVNPMLTIMAVADRAVRSIAGREPVHEIDEGPAWHARRRSRATVAAS